MTDYEKALALWQRKHITTDAELAEALNGHSISFTTRGRFSSMTA